jgi:hypothetical protein
MRGTDEDSRIGFIKEILRCCPTLEELKIVQSMTNIAQKRKRDKPRLAQKLKRKKATELPTEEGSFVPVSALAVPASETFGEKYWWEDFSEEQIVAFDTELVTLHKLNEKGKHIHSPGSVGVVDFIGNIIPNLNVILLK